MRQAHLDDDPVLDDAADDDKVLHDAASRCFVYKSPPLTLVKCFFCDMDFDGPQAWSKRLIHVGKHMETAIESEEDLVDPQDWQVDRATEEYMASMGLLVWYEEHWVLREILQSLGLCDEHGKLTSNKRKRPYPQDYDDSENAAKRRFYRKDTVTEVPDTFGVQELLLSSWNAEMLGGWNGKRDRINRWMLHNLGADPEQAEIYRRVVQKYHALHSLHGALRTANINARHVIRYWFVDDAAVGHNAATASVALSGSLLPPSLMSTRMILPSAKSSLQ